MQILNSATIHNLHGLSIDSSDDSIMEDFAASWNSFQTLWNKLHSGLHYFILSQFPDTFYVIVYIIIRNVFCLTLLLRRCCIMQMISSHFFKLCNWTRLKIRWLILYSWKFLVWGSRMNLDESENTKHSGYAFAHPPRQPWTTSSRLLRACGSLDLAKLHQSYPVQAGFIPYIGTVHSIPLRTKCNQ